MRPDTDKYQTYNYTDLFVKYFFKNESVCNRACPEYVLIFVFSGELAVCCDNHKTTIRKGEYVFLRKNINTVLSRKACNGETFKSVFMGFNPTFLREFYQNMNKKELAGEREYFTTGFLKLPRNPYLESMYISLLPYLDLNVQPMQQFVEIKMIEAVFSLLLTDKRFNSCLFDFPDRISTKIILNEYMQHLYVKYFSGFSDYFFSESCNSSLKISPVKWTISKELETSYIKIKQPDNAINIYMEVDYKNVIRISKTSRMPYGLIQPN